MGLNTISKNYQHLKFLRRSFVAPPSNKTHIVSVECCCILIIYYCWQASSASLPSRARRMTSFVKIFRSVGVERLALTGVLLLLTLFFIFGTFFSMRRRSVWASGGRGVLVEWLLFSKTRLFRERCIDFCDVVCRDLHRATSYTSCCEYMG